MDHEAATGHLADWATGRIADARLRAEVSAHVDSCHECTGIAAIAREIEALVAEQGSSVLGRDEAVAVAEPRVRYEIEDARAGAGAVLRPRSRRAALVAAIAASVLVVAGGIWGLTTRRSAGIARPIVISSLPGFPGIVRGPAELGELEVALDRNATEVPFVVAFEASEPIARLSITVRRADNGTVVSKMVASNVPPERGVVWAEFGVARRLLPSGPYVVSVTRDPGHEVVRRSVRILDDR